MRNCWEEPPSGSDGKAWALAQACKMFNNHIIYGRNARAFLLYIHKYTKQNQYKSQLKQTLNFESNLELMNPDELVGEESRKNCNFCFHDQCKESITGDVKNSQAEIPAGWTPTSDIVYSWVKAKNRMKWRRWFTIEAPMVLKAPGKGMAT